MTLLSIVFSNVIFAVESSDSEIESNLLVITSRQTVDNDSHIGNIDNISSEEIARVKHNHIQELLIRVPGVNIQRGNGQESLPAIRSPVLTGAGACGGFLLAEDDIPLRAAGFCNVNSLFEAHTEQAENIEVIRGPGSAYYGSNAIHGFVNVLTPGVPEEKQVLFGLEVGSYDFQRFKGSYANANQGFNFHITLDQDGGYRDESGLEQQKLSSRHLYSSEDFTIETGLTLTNLNQETAGFIVGKDSYRDSLVARSNLNPEAFRDASSARIWSKFKIQLRADNYFLFTPYFRNSQMEFKQHFLPGKPIEENGQNSLGFQSALYLSGNNDVEYSFGLDAETTNSFLKQTQDLATTGSAFLQATIPEGKHYDYEVDAIMLAPFIHLHWQLSESWDLTAGIRYEKMTYDYNNLMLDGRTREDGTTCGFGGCRYSRPSDSEDSFSNLSPKIGLSYQLANDWLLFTNLTRGFRAPQATELYRLQREQIITDLESVEIDSYEIGLRAANFEVVYYEMKKTNAIFRDSDFFTISDGETEYKGLEARFEYQVTDRFNISVNASLAEHRYLSDQLLSGININGNFIDTAPKHFGNIQFNWKLLSDIDLELEWLHQGSYFMDAENAHKYPGHELVNLRASKVLSSQWRIFGRINNLLDKKYAERADYTFFTEERYFPGRPLTIFLGVQWQQ